MSEASIWSDLVVGIDLHVILVPVAPPPAMAPVPAPLPFTGVIFDPIGYQVGQCINSLISSWFSDEPPPPTGPVKIGGAFASVTGDETMFEVHVLPSPAQWPGGAPGEGILFRGARDITFLGGLAVREFDNALSCSDPKNLPSSLVIPLACITNPVLIIREAATDWKMLMMRAAMKAVLKSAGKAIKSVRTRWMAELGHAKIAKLPKKWNRARNAFHKALCFVTGHPVNVANGCMFTTWFDFELPGSIPLTFAREYNSGFSDRDSPLGYGWSHSFDQRLWIEPHRVVYLAEDGRELEFDTFDFPEHVMRKGDSVYDPINRLTLRALGGFRWEIESHDGLVKEFGPIRGERVEHRDRGLSRITRIRSRDGHEVHFLYDERARLVEVIDASGRRIGLEYDRQEHLKHIWLPTADGTGRRQHAHFLYSDDGDLIEARDANGKPVRFEYNQHLMVRETDRNGLNFYFAYDGWGPFARCIRTWGDGGLYDHVIDYDVQNFRTMVTNSLGATTMYTMDPTGIVTKVTDPRGGETCYEYDDCFRKVVETDPLGHTTRYDYDAQGNQIRIQGPDGAVTKVQYDGMNNPVWLCTPNGAQWRWSYDQWGRLTSRVDPLGQCTRFFYENRSLVAIQDPAGHCTRLGYDSSGNLAEWAGADGTRTRVRYDALGRPVRIVDAKGNEQRRTYDAEGRLLRVDEPDGNIRVFEYDASGNVLRAQDRLRDYRFTYYGLGKIASRSIGGTTVRFEYDTEEQLIAVVNEKGHEYRFERDAAGNVESEYGFDGVRRLYDRDRAGRITKVYRPGIRNESTFEYDAAGRTTKIQHSDGFTESFVYDKNGALIEATNDVITVKMERDALGRIIKEWQGEHWVESVYNVQGHRVGMQTSLGLKQTIERDVMGDVMDITAKHEGATWHASFRRDAVGLEVERLLPGGARSQWWRDSIGRPTTHLIGTVDETGQRLIRGRRYSWGVDDRLIAIGEEGRGIERYEHDARGFLARTILPDEDIQLRMPDEVGNLFRTQQRNDREHGPAGELRTMRTSEGIRTYSYDAEGNLKRRVDPDGGVWEFHWNGAGRLSRVHRPDGEQVLFAYDALGRRIVKQTSSQRRWWIWDRDVLVHEQDEIFGGHEDEIYPLPAFEASNGSPRGPPELRSEYRRRPCITWIFEDDRFAPLARLENGEAHSIVCDHRDAPLSVLDDSGCASWQGHVDTWGMATTAGFAELCPWRFAGQYRDEETGLYYNRFRYYAPEEGRYLSQDPIGLVGGLALYGYVNDPLVQLDPFGLAKSGYAAKGGGLERFPDWKVGDSITKVTSEGNYPSWSVIRSRYWQNRAALEGANFAPANRAIMKKGFAPKARVIVRGRKAGAIKEILVIKELHHVRGNPGKPGFDGPADLREVWPWEHEKLLPPGRLLDYDFIRFK